MHKIIYLPLAKMFAFIIFLPVLLLAFDSGKVASLISKCKFL